jgi:hypothetical protein
LQGIFEKWGRNFALAFRVFDNFLSANHCPSERSLNKVIEAFLDADYDEKALELLLKAYNHGQKVDMNCHLRKLLLLQKTDLAKRVVLELKAHGSETVYLWEYFIGYCCQKGLLEVLIPLLSQVALKYKENKPDFVSALFKSYETNLTMSKNSKALSEFIGMILQDKVPLKQETVRSIIKNVHPLLFPHKIRAPPTPVSTTSFSKSSRNTTP